MSNCLQTLSGTSLPVNACHVYPRKRQATPSVGVVESLQMQPEQVALFVQRTPVLVCFGSFDQNFFVADRAGWKRGFLGNRAWTCVMERTAYAGHWGDLP